MPTVLHSKDVVVLLGKYDLTNYIRAHTPEQEFEAADVSVYGRAYKESIPGQIAGVCKLEGIAGFGVGESMDIVTAIRGTEKALSILMPGTTLGDYAILLNGTVSQSSNPASIQDAVGLELEVRGADGLDYGKVLHVLAARTSTGNGTSVDDAAATSTGASANLHCTAASGTSPSLTVKVQDSADNSSWADIITFTALTAAGQEHKTITGTVRRYVRVIWTISGTSPSFTFAVTFARR